MLTLDVPLVADDPDRSVYRKITLEIKRNLVCDGRVAILSVTPTTRFRLNTVFRETYFLSSELLAQYSRNSQLIIRVKLFYLDAYRKISIVHSLSSYIVRFGYCGLYSIKHVLKSWPTNPPF